MLSVRVGGRGHCLMCLNPLPTLLRHLHLPPLASHLHRPRRPLRHISMMTLQLPVEQRCGLVWRRVMGRPAPH